MGIQGLTTQLRPYGTITSFEQSTGDPSQRRTAIIDGPALVHFVFNKTRPEVRTNGVIPLCDYNVLGKAVVKWLDRLHTFGFDIAGIFFDGALPASKAETRVKRMQHGIEQLSKFKEFHDKLAKSITLRSGKAPTENSISSTRFADRLPLAPFMILAAMEALFASRYAEQTWIVKDEADGYCAAGAVEATLYTGKGAYIFTADSDLCIFRFRTPVRVVMLNDMEESTHFDTKVLKLREFCPLAMKINGKEPDLVAVAYIMQNQDVTLAEALRQCDLSKPESQQYTQFTETYEPLCYLPQLEPLRSRRKEHGLLLLDPRISEPIAGVEEIIAARLSNALPEMDGELEFGLYLPVLLEDPTRASAWKVGARFREIAEGLLLLHTKFSPSSLLEYRRSGAQLRPTTVRQVAFSEIELQSQALHQQMALLADSVAVRELPPMAMWKATVMIMAVKGRVDVGMPLPAAESVVEILAGKAMASWETVHLSAQFQAMYYSLRMIKQVHSWQATRACDGLEKLDDALTGLVSVLPGVADFFMTDASVAESTWVKLTDAFLRELSITHPPVLTEE